ncbi:histidine kinase [Mucilaginibacter sp. RS28]|uniref:Histidine kinase n=1 Tax=Mucilaginibacter straminoryzae TaxID=2932774 RepID=A0A9X2B7Q6_9SPHI|nr:histidine kinase [Mucilaginibacter straminoryzae]MCJ8208844.1 histidine kinase [Mucilaginibacter straminoryzae]
MQMRRAKWNWKYLRIELFVLFFISFLISVISDLEYSAYEQHDVSRFAEDLDYRLVCGVYSFILYGLFYWLFLKPYVLRGKIWAVLLCLIGFVFVNQLAHHYVLNWIIRHSAFISADIRARASTTHLYFAVNYLFISVFFPLLGLAFLIRTLQQSEAMKTLKEQQLFSELNYLKAQLHPHFFFNTINNIYSLALQNSPMTASMVARLGELMRYILYEANQSRVPLQQEIKFLGSYVEVEKMRYAGEKEISFDVQGVDESHQIEPLLLLPFIENAFKHGLAEETGEGFVRIVICRTEQELILEVVNSKPTDVNRQEPGIGIENVCKRLELLYPDRYLLEVQEDERQYRVHLTLS